MDEMDNFSERCSLPKMTPVEIERINRPIPIERIEKAITEQPHKKAPGPAGFTEEFYDNFRNQMVPTTHPLFLSIEKERNLNKIAHQKGYYKYHS